MQKQIITINGNNFSDLNGFNDEIERVLTKNLGWRIGRNLDAFEDILYGTGYGTFEVTDFIKLVWENFSKSQVDLGLEETRKYYERIISNIDMEPENRSYFKEKLKELNLKKGKMLCEIIVEIISERKNIEFEVHN